MTLIWEGNTDNSKKERMHQVVAVCDCCDDYIRVKAKVLGEEDSAFIDLMHDGWTMEFKTRKCLCPVCAKKFGRPPVFFKMADKRKIMGDEDEYIFDRERQGRGLY